MALTSTHFRTAIQIEDSAAPAITGTAAAAIAKPTLAVSGAETFSGSDAIAFAKPSPAAQGAETFTGAAAVADQPAALASTGSHGYAASGAVTTPSVALAGQGAEGFTASGAVVFGPTFASAGAETFTGVAAVIAPHASLESTASQTSTGSGAMSLSTASVEASATQQVMVSGVGALAIQTPVLQASESSEPIDGTGDLALGFTVTLNGALTNPQTALLMSPVVWRGSLVAPIVSPRQIPAVSGSAGVMAKRPAIVVAGTTTNRSAIIHAAPVFAAVGGVATQGTAQAVTRSDVVARGGVWNPAERRHAAIHGSISVEARASVTGHANAADVSVHVPRTRRQKPTPHLVAPVSQSIIAADDWFLEEVA